MLRFYDLEVVILCKIDIIKELEVKIVKAKELRANHEAPADPEADV